MGEIEQDLEDLAWRLRNSAGREWRCEVQDHTRAAGGWRVVLFEGDHPLVISQWSLEHQAVRASSDLRDDLRLAGWFGD